MAASEETVDVSNRNWRADGSTWWRIPDLPRRILPDEPTRGWDYAARGGPVDEKSPEQAGLGEKSKVQIYLPSACKASITS